MSVNCFFSGDFVARIIALSLKKYFWHGYTYFWKTYQPNNSVTYLILSQFYLLMVLLNICTPGSQMAHFHQNISGKRSSDLQYQKNIPHNGTTECWTTLIFTVFYLQPGIRAFLLYGQFLPTLMKSIFCCKSRIKLESDKCGFSQGSLQI